MTCGMHAEDLILHHLQVDVSQLDEEDASGEIDEGGEDPGNDEDEDATPEIAKIEEVAPSAQELKQMMTVFLEQLPWMVNR